MSDTSIITISRSRGLKTNGDIVAGVLNLNLALAEEKDVISVMISLRGAINTQVTVSSGPAGSANNRSSTTYRDSVQLFTEEQVIWSPGSPAPPHASGIASFPFSFTMPTTELPPSFHGGTSMTGGSVQYYLHAVAHRKSWYQRNARIDNVFPFLPFDRTPAPYLPLPDWPGEWHVFKAEKKIRRGIISHHGLAEVEFYMPKLAAIPLFRPIPVRLRVICTSKPLSSSAKDQPGKFEFPRNPKATDVDLTLRQVCEVAIGVDKATCTDQLGLQAGFGLPKKKEARANWGNQIQTTITPPCWIVDERDKGKGRWFEDVTFSSTVVFRCPPPFSSPSLTSSLYLDLDVDFPGIMNNVKTQIGPLPLTTGIPPPQAQPSPYGQLVGESFPQSPVTLQPQLLEMDLPPSYYEVMYTDEKAGSARED